MVMGFGPLEKQLAKARGVNALVTQARPKPKATRVARKAGRAVTSGSGSRSMAVRKAWAKRRR